MRGVAQRSDWREVHVVDDRNDTLSVGRESQTCDGLKKTGTREVLSIIMGHVYIPATVIAITNLPGKDIERQPISSER
jgi:hypothetical protein